MSPKLWTDVYDDGFDDIASTPFPPMLDSDIENSNLLAPYLPSSRAVVKEALTMALSGMSEPRSLLELGAGDGRFCVAAVQEFGLKLAIGLELDEELVDIARTKATECGVPVLGRDAYTSKPPREQVGASIFESGDLTKDFLARVHADIVVVCLLGETNTLPTVRDVILEHYRRGSRILAVLFDLSKIEEMELRASSPRGGLWLYYQ
ncbi:hypothetical protein M427DRAFT_153908 [Gonapodya prolifera JEL478]|uniref:Methyltransferase domain-containing protein n=1 Tax=Gonapodya prolifera (strain JEL478) TaxID=1344416 RepID=A0A139AKX6_GONPJ|nr:hypothetical protein M427DRAFT_153908 [Gonapodya prolifera JEL478]|eukprot:KXS17426.1 hypothetical protein M427DRAFT_153908 [Gonapodya prolifera JEL478]